MKAWFLFADGEEHEFELPHAHRTESVRWHGHVHLFYAHRFSGGRFVFVERGIPETVRLKIHIGRALERTHENTDAELGVST